MRWLRTSVALALLGIGACGQAPNDLWGSIEESFPLAFDRVDLLKQNLALRIEYIKELHGGEDKICKVVVNTGDAKIKDDTELKDKSFEEETVTVERVAATGGNFPAIDGGTITFDTFRFKDGGKIDGDFTVLFDNGRNLFGNFEGMVEEISTE
ncbi:hypothetical protein ACFL6C_12825 [Myxococcota bacterium]